MGFRLILSANSDIGFELAKKWVHEGHQVLGTHRNKSSKDRLSEIGAASYYCDFLDKRSLEMVVSSISEYLGKEKLEGIVFANGTTEPIGPFRDIPFQALEDSIQSNFLQPLGLLQRLLPLTSIGSTIVFFAGSGTNGPANNYAAYTLSKISLIKSCELLASEDPCRKYVALGPGWVRTKIHEQTLKASELAGANYERTLERLKSGRFVKMETVLSYIDWLFKSEIRTVSGRNFSVTNDPIGSDKFTSWLDSNENHYKLRRSGNDYVDGERSGHAHNIKVNLDSIAPDSRGNSKASNIKD